ncbi:hypothetical protein [Candidatus Rhodobacter oscarellae]|uniref:hypothetical protein n=1 Tax=Candidatus Rhodobacter oscarellae TaxID=1675527 RepID=UPI00128F4EFD|nr:hypothetical protein [Candidatus Rhodobacter lobularis]
MSEISVPEGVLTFPKTASNEELLDGVRKWVDLLSENRFSEAYNLTAHDSYYAWTPELIQSVVAGYGMPHEPGDHVYGISKISQTEGGPSPRWEVDRWQDAEPSSRIGFVSFDLPLDGEWSDLTATFEVMQVKEQFVLVLQDIHVF